MVVYVSCSNLKIHICCHLFYFTTVRSVVTFNGTTKETLRLTIIYCQGTKKRYSDDVLLTRGNNNNNVFLVYSTQRPSAAETKQTEYRWLTLFVFARRGCMI